MAIQRNIAGGVLLCAIALSAWGARVDDLRVWHGPEHTRTVLDISAPVEYRLFTLTNPNRVVIDLSSAEAGKLRVPDTAGPLLGGVRTGKRGGDGLRVVLDLNAAARPRSFLLAPAAQYGHRLVVDLYPEAVDSPQEPARVLDLEASRDVIVAIDAGHGGEDPGAIGPTGVREKVVALAIAEKLKARLDERPGFKGLLVRTGDYYIPHLERPGKARQHRADLFVSIHADAFKDRRVKGSSVFVLSRRRASSEAAKYLANRANNSDLVGGVSLSDKDATLAAVLLDLSQGASMDVSKGVGANVLEALAEVGPTHKDYVESAPFAVLTAPDIPSILVETGYISNPTEEKRLKSAKWQRRIASAIADGIEEFFYDRPPPETWLAQNRIRASHVVARGDTLSGIAQKHQVSTRTLRKVNDIRGDFLKVGEVLTIPSPGR